MSATKERNAVIMKMTTLCYLEKADCYLMLHRVKKEKDLNKDKWIGVGGHMEPGESPEECVVREVREETGLVMDEYRFRGIVTFDSDDCETEYMCLFTSNCFRGEIIECDEGTLEWIPKDRVESLNLWEGDKLMFQLLKERESFFSLKLSYRQGQLIAASVDGVDREFFDVIDLYGNCTGQVKERSLAHTEGTLHKTAHIWIVRPNDSDSFDVLLQKRSSNKDSDPGCYDISSAGHIPVGSQIEDSALRELEEELGLTAKADDIHFAFWHEVELKDTFYGKPFCNHELSGVYYYTKPVDETKLVLQPDEVDAVMWMDYEECLAHVIARDPNFCINEQEFIKLKEYIRWN